MAEQSFARHGHHPVPTYVATVFALIAIVFLVGAWLFDRDTLEIGVVSLSIAVVTLVSISRTYIVRLQDRIILLEMKVRCAEVLPAGQDARLGATDSQADRGAALCVRRRARRPAGAGDSGEAPAPRDQARRETLASGLPSHLRAEALSAERPTAPMTPDEKHEVLHLIEAHERTLAVCRACAETARDLAWEVKRGGQPDPDALRQTIEEIERILADLGKWRSRLPR